jgi:hypothetical protein
MREFLIGVSVLAPHDNVKFLASPFCWVRENRPRDDNDERRFNRFPQWEKDQFATT